MKATALALSACFVLVRCQSSQQATVGLGGDPARQTDYHVFDEAFDEHVEYLLQHFHVPGVSIAIVNGNQTYAKGYGYATIPSEPATPHTLYYVGSTTKSFTAASMLKLIEASANHTQPITLKTKISDLIREDFVLSDPYATAHVTLEDAMSHRTGLPRHDASYSGSNGSLSTFVRGMRHLKFSAELRERWQYNNMMFIAVSHVIESLTGRWLGDYMRESIWGPLGMTGTYLGLTEARLGPEHLATGYRWNNAPREYSPVEYLDHNVISGAGNIVSNVLDYAKYLRAMITKDPAVLSAASYEELRTPRAFSSSGSSSTLWASPEMYTLGWQMTNYRGYEIFLHGGGIDGFGTEMAYLPGLGEGVGFAGFANTDVTSNWVTWAIMFRVLDDLAGTPPEKRINWVKVFDTVISKAREQATPEVARKKLYPDAPAPDKKLPLPVPIEAYAGTYHNAGYQNLTVQCVNLIDLPKQPRDGLHTERVLYADVTDKIWLHDIVFEHVTGNYFIAWMEHHTNEVLGKEARAARFELDSTGSVARLGIDYEPELGQNDLIWFDRLSAPAH